MGKRTEYQRRLKDRKMAAGLCVTCREFHLGKMEECSDCRAARSKHTRAVRAKRKSLGLCVDCGQNNPAEAFLSCSSCLTKQRERKKRKAARGECRYCANPRLSNNHLCASCLSRSLWRITKSRSEILGIPFSIKIEDVVIPTRCPILGIPIFQGTGKLCDNSPSVDKMVPSLGYVPGNVAVISYRANRLKNNGTAIEFRKIADWMDQQSI